MDDIKLYKKHGNMLPSLWQITRQNNWLSLLVLCVLLVFVWRCCFLYQKAQVPYLQIPVTSSTIGTVQLYYDQGYGFNEHDSVVKGLEKNGQKLWGVIPWETHWRGKGDLYYSFQLPLNSIHEFRVKSLNDNQKQLVKHAAIVNGLGTFIQAVNIQQLHGSDGGSNTTEKDWKKEYVKDSVFVPPLMLGQLQLVQINSLIVRALVELLFLIVLTIIFGKLTRCVLSMAFMRPLYGANSILSNRSTQNQIIFIFLTIIFLWFYRPFAERLFPMLFEKAIFGILVILTFRSILKSDWKKISSTIIYVSFFYLLLCVVSASMHYFALKSLSINNYLYYFNTSFQGILFDNYHGINRLAGESTIYIYLFPFMLISATSLFVQVNKGWKMLLWISYLYLPCLVVAFFQVYVDGDFLNNRPGIDFVGGLSISFIAFRILLFLIFPLYVYGFLLANKWWSKALTFIPIVATLWLAKLSNGRASIFGILIFVVLLPIILIWSNGKRNKNRNYLYAVGTVLLGLTIIVGIAFPNFHAITSKVLTPRLVEMTYGLLNGRSDVNPRLEMQAHAIKLIKTAPVAGWGAAGFMKNVNRLRFVDGEKTGISQPMTSLYLGVLLNFGVLGLCYIVFLFCMPLVMIFRVREKLEYPEEKLAVGISVSVLFIMLLLFNTNPNIDYQDVHWIFVLYLGFLLAVSQKYNDSISFNRYRPLIVCGLFLILLLPIAMYRTTFGNLGYGKIQNELLSRITNRYKISAQQILWNNKRNTESSGMSNTLIETHGNPFRMQYTNNVFRSVATVPYRVEDGVGRLCIKTSILKKGDLGSFILDLKVYLNNVELTKHVYRTSGVKNLFFEINKMNSEIRIEADLKKSIPYHEDDRLEIVQKKYNPVHRDYGDLDVTISAISFSATSYDKNYKLVTLADFESL